MTVVAWDGRTLAADRQTTSGNARCTPTTKIARVGDRLFAWAGPLADALAIKRWVVDGKDPARFPTIESGRTPIVIVIERGGTLREFCGSRHAIEYDAAHPYAMGCGEEAAYTAMLCGKSAAEAVEVVSRVNVYCGDGVDALTFEDIAGRLPPR